MSQAVREKSYFVPMALAWEEREVALVRALAPVTLAMVRQQASVGVLGDAFADETFCRALVAAIGAGREIATAGGVLRFAPTDAFREIAGDDIAALAVGRAGAQSSNTVVALGERLFLKGYRRLRPGVNTELEIGRDLTQTVRFPNCVPRAGAIEHVAKDGTPTTLALLQAFVHNQGDGWSYTLAYLERHLESVRDAAEPALAAPHGAYLELAPWPNMSTPCRTTSTVRFGPRKSGW
jgi:maltose alpha-D-glucosyltransferase/alpha-amylase